MFRRPATRTTDGAQGFVSLFLIKESGGSQTSSVIFENVNSGVLTEELAVNIIFTDKSPAVISEI